MSNYSYNLGYANSPVKSINEDSIIIGFYYIDGVQYTVTLIKDHVNNIDLLSTSYKKNNIFSVDNIFNYPSGKNKKYFETTVKKCMSMLLKNRIEFINELKKVYQEIEKYN